MTTKGGGKVQLHRDFIIKSIAEGMTTKEVAAFIQCNPNSVAHYCSTHAIYGPGFKMRKKFVNRVRVPDQAAPRVVVRIPLPPPRPSMIALAEFDPVIARALRQRLRGRPG